MRYNQEDELERMRSRRGRRQEPSYNNYEEDYDEDYRNYADSSDDDLEEVYIDDRSSGRGGRPVRKTSRQTSGSDSARRRYVQNQSVRQRRESSTGRSSRYNEERRQEGSRMRQEGGRPRQQKAARKKRRGNGLKIVLIAVLVCLIGFGAWSILHRPTGVWTIAVFGVDSRDGATDKALADVQMICAVDRETGEIKLTSVYRDTYLKIDSDGTYHKINEAYFKGGHEQAVNALEENLDLKIDNYATFNWKAVAQAINVLGGIDLEITDAEFAYINAFITETVNSTGIGSVQLDHAGMQHLDGIQAVAYCRLRLMDTDFQRTERQRKVVSLALEKAKAADAGTLTQLVSAILPQISTDIGIDDLLPMAKNISSYHLGETAGFPFSRETAKIGRMDCVIPTTLESNVSQLHQFLYGEENYRPSSTVRSISEKISEDSGLYEEGTPAPTGGSSGGSSGKAEAQPAPEVPAETQPETSAEETTAQETLESIEETTGEEADETEEEESESNGLGTVYPSQTRESKEDDEMAEETRRPTSSQEKEESSDNSSETHGIIAPDGPGSLPTEPEIGPGV